MSAKVVSYPNADFSTVMSIFSGCATPGQGIYDSCILLGGSAFRQIKRVEEHTIYGGVFWIPPTLIISILQMGKWRLRETDL